MAPAWRNRFFIDGAQSGVDRHDTCPYNEEANRQQWFRGQSWAGYLIAEGSDATAHAYLIGAEAAEVGGKEDHNPYPSAYAAHTVWNTGHRSASALDLGDMPHTRGRIAFFEDLGEPRENPRSMQGWRFAKMLAIAIRDGGRSAPRPPGSGEALPDAPPPPTQKEAPMAQDNEMRREAWEQAGVLIRKGVNESGKWEWFIMADPNDEGALAEEECAECYDTLTECIDNLVSEHESPAAYTARRGSPTEPDIAEWLAAGIKIVREGGMWSVQQKDSDGDWIDDSDYDHTIWLADLLAGLHRNMDQQKMIDALDYPKRAATEQVQRADEIAAHAALGFRIEYVAGSGWDWNGTFDRGEGDEDFSAYAYTDTLDEIIEAIRQSDIWSDMGFGEDQYQEALAKVRSAATPKPVQLDADGGYVPPTDPTPADRIRAHLARIAQEGGGHGD